MQQMLKAKFATIEEVQSRIGDDVGACGLLEFLFLSFTLLVQAKRMDFGSAHFKWRPKSRNEHSVSECNVRSFPREYAKKSFILVIGLPSGYMASIPSIQALLMYVNVRKSTV